MKKGIQYSHYCGTELMEIVSGINLLLEYMKEAKNDEAIKWGQYAQKMTEQLRDKIAELDKINEMKY